MRSDFSMCVAVCLLALARHFFRSAILYVVGGGLENIAFSSKSDIRQEKPINFVTLNCIWTELTVLLNCSVKLLCYRVLSVSLRSERVAVSLLLDSA